MSNPLMDRLLKNSPTKYASVLATSDFFNAKDIITTDIPIINVAFSGDIDGGISSGLTLLAGPSKTFKTNVSLVCIRAYLNKYEDAVCIFYDSEGGLTPEYLESQGIDPNRVLHVQIEHLEMLKFDLVKQLQGIKRGDKVIILIDSIGNTASLKELEDAVNEETKVEMQRPKVIKGLFRMITPSLVNKDIPCIAICHTYEELKMYGKTIISGGTGLMYSANQAFIISKAQEKEKKDGPIVGWNFTLNVEKSRFVRERAKLEFQVLYDKGIQKYSGLLDLALECGLVVKPTVGWYSKVDSDGVISETKYREKNTGTKVFWDDILANPKFKQFVINKFKLVNEHNDTYNADEELANYLADDEEEDEKPARLGKSNWKGE